MNVFSVEFARLLFYAQPIIAMIGIFFNLLGTFDAITDLGLTKAANGARRLVAVLHVEWEIIRLVIQILLIVSGVLYLRDPPLDIYTRTTSIGVQRLILMVITLLTASKSILGQRQKHQVIRFWLAEQEEKKGV